MIESKFLEKLLEGEEVEWVQLAHGEDKLTQLRRGRVMSKGYLVENSGDYPVYSSQTARNGQIGKINTFDFDGESITWTTDGANAGTVFHRTGKFSITNVCGIIRISDNRRLNYSYLFHYLSFNTQKHVYAGMGNPKLMSNQMAKIPIPIPCPSNPEKSLAIQAEIARILDTFTELTTELTSELSARKKQYNHYRDQLLTFKEGEVEWKTLGEISFKSYSGSTPKAGKAKYYDGGTIPWLRTQEVKFADIVKVAMKITPAALKETAAKWIPENCVIVAISGATAGRSAINKIPTTTNQHCCCLEIDPEQAEYRYAFHWVSKNYGKLKGLGQGARGDLNSGIIKDFKIPIPYSKFPKKSLAEQARIVGILDKFDTLTHSISEGLPREIELRQKQYEYYCDLLLNFPKPEKELSA